jgi:hypothetical protein
MESLEPTIDLKTHPRKPKSSQWMENLDPLRTRFKNLDYIKSRPVEEPVSRTQITRRNTTKVVIYL